MAFPKKLGELCSPSFVYFTVSMFMFVIMIFQNMGDNTHYNLAHFSRTVPNTTIIFIAKLIYILFWTWVLNLICKDGYTNIAWVLVLFPIILLFTVLGIMMLVM
jgi:hypothetical protein